MMGLHSIERVWIYYTKIFNIKIYIKLHFPNKYWSVFIKMPKNIFLRLSYQKDK